MRYQALIAGALAGTALSSPTNKRQAQSLTGNTQNGLTAGACKDVTVIFARGTTESGNVGTVVGPPVFQAIASKMGATTMAVQGVEYPANVQGFLAGGDAAGSKTMADLVTKAMTMCPNTQVVMAGYSQGGQLVHNAAKSLPAATTSKVAAALIFGDPMNGTAVQGVSAAKTKVICHDQDNICQHGSTIKQAHLTYGTMNAGEAADFISAVVKPKAAAGMPAGSAAGNSTRKH